MRRKTPQARTLAVVLLLALSSWGCDSDSPTAPTVAPSSPPASTTSGGSAAWAITVTVDPPSVGLDDILAGLSTASIVVTARRADNGQLPPERATVVLTASRGTLVNSAGTIAGASIPVSFDTGGRALAVLNLPQVAGALVVQARFEQSVGQATIQILEEDPGVPLFIEAVVPSTGPPSGGTRVRIEGSGFNRPVRVTFGGLNANVVSVSGNLIVAETPPVTLSVGETLTVAVSVTINVNDPDPDQPTATDTLSNAFTYARAGQTEAPRIVSVSPTSGPNEGGTLVTILGEGFADQVQVFFGTSALIEAPVIEVSPTRLLVETPSATGPNSINQNAIVNVRVVNTVSGLFDERPSAFQYGGPGTPVMFISAAGPGTGLYLGGTLVTIFGQGFDEPVAVEFGGFGQQVISVTGTEIIARSVPVIIENCTEVSGPFGVTNIETNESAQSSINFVYLPIHPVIFAVDPSSATADVVTGAVVGAIRNTIVRGGGFDVPQVIFGETAASIVAGSQRLDDNFDPRFNIFREVGVVIPRLAEPFPTGECTLGGESGTVFLPVSVDVTVVNLATGCEEIFVNGFTYFPSDTTCRLPPPPPPPPPEPPIAAFSFQGLTGSFEVTFLNQTTGTAPLAFSWNFGDGSAPVAAANPPPHTYAAAGIYVVTLTATNAAGSDSASQFVTIPVP